MATDALGLPIAASKSYFVVGVATPVIGTNRVTLVFGDRFDQKLVVQANLLCNQTDLLTAIGIAGNAVWAALSHAHFNADLPQLKWKNVRCRTTANVNLAGGGLAAGTTIDGYALVASDLVLVAAQTTAAENGIYLVPPSGAASRVTDFDTDDDIRGAVIMVERGTANGGTFWAVTNTSTITVGSTTITFALMHGRTNEVVVLDAVGGNPASTVGASVSTEQTAYTFTIPGGTLGSLGCCRLHFEADILNNSGGASTFTVRVKYGGTTMWGDSTSLTASANRRSFRVDCGLYALNSSSSQRVAGLIAIGDGAAGSVAGTGDLDSGVKLITNFHGTASADSASDQAIAITIQFSTTSASQDVRIFNARLVRENP